MARHSKRDANAYERYTADVMKQTRLIRPYLLKRPPDPTSLKLRDLRDLAEFAGSFAEMGEEGLADTLKFWTKSVGDYLDEYFETDVIKAHLGGTGVIGTALGVVGGILLAQNIATVVPFLERIFGFALFPSDIYYITELPSDLRRSDVVAFAVMSLGMSLLSTLYPAWRASRTDPAEALRYE